MNKANPFHYFQPPGGHDVRRFPSSLRNVEDLLHERGVDVSHESFWWHRFGPMLAGEIQKRRIERMKSSRRRRHLNEMFVKIDGKKHYLWRAVDHEGEVLKLRNKEAGQEGRAEIPQGSDKEARPGTGARDGQASPLRCGSEGPRRGGPAGGFSVAE